MHTLQTLAAASPGVQAPALGLETAPPRARALVRLHSLDALRGVLACVVLADHVALTTFGSHALALAAYCAVLAFFTMSGLVLARAYDRRPLAFFVRRLVRLWPVYAVCLVAGYGLSFRLPPLSEFAWYPLPPHNGFAQIDPPVWTLILEAWATPVLPLLFWIAARGRVWILLTTVASIGLAFIDERMFCLFFFAAGVSAAQFDIPWPQRLPGWSLWLGKISYSLYLSHGLVIVIAMTMLGPVGPLLAVPSMFVVGWLVWRLVEQPSIRWSRIAGRSRVNAAV